MKRVSVASSFVNAGTPQSCHFPRAAPCSGAQTHSAYLTAAWTGKPDFEILLQTTKPVQM